MDRNDFIREVILSDTLKFACYFFKKQTGKTFVVGQHHRIVCEALNKVLRGETKRLIINIAPRYSKCIAPNTRIYTSRGLIDAKDVREGDMLYSFDQGKLVLQRCQGIEDARKQSVRITMRSGRTIECSYDHPMLTTFGYKEASKIGVGERIVAMRSGKTDPMVDSFPHKIISHEKLTYKTSKPPYRCASGKEITREKFIRLSETFPQLKKYIHEDFYYDRVDKVEPIGEMDLIHIGVDNTHNFIANGLVSHNTQLAVKSFIAQGLAINPMSRFLHLSYSGDLAQDNSVEIKEIVESEDYKELFGTKIKDGSNTKSHWATEQGGEVYATSTLGQITGFGAGLVDDGQSYRFGGAIIIDDPIKPEDALSDLEREKVNRRFETTIRNRVNSRNTPIIIIMQRLHERDLCGYLTSIEPDDWEVLSIPCIKEDGTALWPFKHTLEELYKIKDASPFVFETQYMQNPKPLEGLMYREFNTYDIIPYHKKAKKLNYTDTADEGSDYFCSVCYEEHPDRIYVTDVIYTKKTMEFTEPEMAKMLKREDTQISMIESNNGGRIFSRNVERISREMGNLKTIFKTFPQTKNKMQRIFTHSNEVCNMIAFPKNWEALWPDFANAVKSFRKEGKNKNDDAPDVLTGIIEHRSSNRTISDAEILNSFL